MNIESIKAAVSKVDEKRDDDEVAHGLEDDLYAEFIKFVRDAGPSELSAMAAEVLKTQEIRFSRWCA